MEELAGVQGTRNAPEQGGLPPGFRFHPTDEELLSFYLASKVFGSNYCGVAIAEVNLNQCEPWDLPETAKLGEREWYLYNIRDKKYPTSLRTDRATRCGYWKATGKDKKVFGASGGGLLGMKKTLVFYKGRAPQREKTSWVMHEYRLEATGVSLRPSVKAEWVLCKIFNKNVEKKDTPLKEQSYLPQAAPSSTADFLPSLPNQSCIPTMPDSQTQALAQTFQSRISPIPQSSPVLFDSLLSCQDPTLPQPWKTFPTSSYQTTLSMDNFKPSIDYYQHLAADAGVPDVST